MQLDDALVETLDAEAKAAGVNRSELIRLAIAEHLRDLQRAEADDLAMASYQRSPESWTGRGWPLE